MPEPTRPRRAHVTDPQLLRLSIVVDALAAMDPREREHAIGYVLRRFAAASEHPADVADLEHRPN